MLVGAMPSVGEVALLLSLSCFSLVLGLAHLTFRCLRWAPDAAAAGIAAVLIGVHSCVVLLLFGSAPL